jgi:NADPH:quinone reductase-like Zn-dependent oxidoreductase
VPNGGNFPNRWFAGGGRVLSSHVLARVASQPLGPFLVSQNHADLIVLKELIETGKVTPVIDRTYALRDTAKAIGHVGEGHARGKVAITV